MTIPCSIEGREHNAFEECPDGSGKPAKRVKVCSSPDDPVFVSLGKSLPVLQIIDYPTANQELEITIPQNAKEFSIKVEGSAKFQISYVQGESLTGFWEVGLYGIYKESELKLSSDLKIYVSANKGSRNFKLRYWT